MTKYGHWCFSCKAFEHLSDKLAEIVQCQCALSWLSDILDMCLDPLVAF